MIGFLEVETENITLDVLKLLQSKEDRYRSYKKFTLKFHDKLKCTVKLNCFTNNFVNLRTNEPLGIRSNVDFHLEVGLWVPRRIELQVSQDPPRLFKCEVDISADGLKYTREVKPLK